MWDSLSVHNWIRSLGIYFSSLLKSALDVGLSNTNADFVRQQSLFGLLALMKGGSFRMMPTNHSARLPSGVRLAAGVFGDGDGSSPAPLTSDGGTEKTKRRRQNS